jgi:hypothetical protein
MPKKIKVAINPDGTPECTPQVTRVRPGGTIIWDGPPHSGVFEGVFPGTPKDNFTLAELHATKPVKGPMPFHPLSWSIGQPGVPDQVTIQVDANAKSGVMYKYTVEAQGKKLDPIVIVDDGAQDS